MLEPASVLMAPQPIATVSEESIARLKKMALNAPLKRARLCLHASHEDAVQEMVIALHWDTYIRPHKHPEKSESFHMIEGSVLIGFFNDEGDILQTLELGSDPGSLFLYRMSIPFWHTVQPLTEFAIFHEVARGPFSGAEYPSWEPKEDFQAIQEFKDRILQAHR